MTEVELLQSILDKLSELQTAIGGINDTLTQLLPIVTSIHTYIAFTVVVGAGAVVIYFMLKPVFYFLR